MLDVMMRLRSKAEIIPFRPRIYELNGPLAGFVQLIRECWEENPLRRPSAAKILSRLKDISGGKY